MCPLWIVRGSGSLTDATAWCVGLLGLKDQWFVGKTGPFQVERDLRMECPCRQSIRVVVSDTAAAPKGHEIEWHLR